MLLEAPGQLYGSVAWQERGLIDVKNLVPLLRYYSLNRPLV
jgi:hypothetical protein